MDKALLTFSGLSGLTFGIIGISILAWFFVHILILVNLAKLVKLSARIIRANLNAEKARKEIIERDRKRILRMIRRKATDEEWAQLLAELGEDDKRLTEE
jgi:hypothetical protein